VGRPSKIQKAVALRDGPLWAWTFGRPMNGGPAPGATRGERAAWRARRAGWRHGALVAVVVIGIEALTDPAGLAIIAAAALISAVYLTWLWWKGRPHYREYTKPLHRRLLEAGVPLEGHRPEKHLHIPTDLDRVVFHLPHHWHAPERHLEAVEAAIAHTCKLGAGYEVTRKLDGRKRHLLLTKPPLWPGKVGLADIMPAIEAAPQWYIPVGLGRGGEPFGFQIAESGANPHGLINGPSLTAGKSTTAKLICSVFMRHGGVVIICDVAQLSHPWAHTFRDGGAPNAVVLRTVEEIAEALIWLKGEMEDRVTVGVYAQRRSGALDCDLGVKILLVLEEMVSLMADLKDDYPDAVEALVKLVVRGRHPGIHVCILAQRAEARTLAGKYGAQVRENLGWKFLGVGTSPATLKFLAEGLAYPPGGVKGGQGRYGAVVGREWADVQVAYLSNDEAFQLATSGTVAALPAGFPVPSLPAMPRTAVIEAVTDNRGFALPPGESFPEGAMTEPVVTDPAGPALVSLSDVAADRRELDRLRQQRQRFRNKGFPVPAAREGSTELFEPADLYAWMQSRSA
jgi:hypothetical protein